jgi:hypothetical protein
VQLLRQALTPARSAPLESVSQPVREVKPLLNQTPAPTPAPARSLAIIRQGGRLDPTPTQPKVIPNPAPPGDKKGKGPKALPAERPSTHGMTTRRQLQQATDPQPAPAATVATVAPKVEIPRPVVPDYYEESKLGSGWVTVTHKKRRSNPVVGAATIAKAVVAAAVAALPTAQAHPAFPVIQESSGVLGPGSCSCSCLGLFRSDAPSGTWEQPQLADCQLRLAGLAAILWTAQVAGWTVSVTTLRPLRCAPGIAPYLATTPSHSALLLPTFGTGQSAHFSVRPCHHD